MEMAVVHDLGELSAGDYTPHDEIPKRKCSPQFVILRLINVDKKHEQEKLFFQWLQCILPDHPASKLMMDRWQEYEDMVTPEALWLYDADKMESVIQSREYTMRGHANLEEFLQLIPRFTTSQMAAWGRVVHEELQQDQTPKLQIPIIFVTGMLCPCLGKIGLNSI